MNGGCKRSLVVTWNIRHAEKALGIAIALRRFQGLLELKKRGVLGEEETANAPMAASAME